jgi:hypothetical protein
MQTSIEWLIEQLLGNGLLRLTKEDHSLYSELRDKVKEIHKQEIIKSNRDGVDMVIDKKRFVTGEQYYQETFKKKIT